MKRTDEPIDPSVLAELDALDAVLAGDPVDPRHAELAELALLVAGERPTIDPRFAAQLDGRVERRFAAPRPADRAGVASAPRRRRRRWIGWTVGLAAPAAAAIAVVAVLSGGGSKPSGIFRSYAATPTTARSAAASSSGVPRRASEGVARTDQGVAASAPAPAVRPPSNGRKVVQSADLALSSAPSHIDDVAQEVFDVVGRESGVVNSSTVTASAQGYAQFELSIPSGHLSDAMTALSQLRFAHVSSRTDNSEDVNGQFVSANRQLADDRALRTSLLKQLGRATTQTQIESLKAQIHDAEQAIARDQAALRSLDSRINYSRVEVTVNSAITPVAVRHHASGGFTLGKAAHDAGRVLTVAAGVALIALAALIPVLLVAALIWWIAAALRRRRREQALDAA